MRTPSINYRTILKSFLAGAVFFSFLSLATAGEPLVSPSSKDDSLMDEVMGVTNPVLGLPYKIPVLGNMMEAAAWPVKKTAGFVLSPFQRAADLIPHDQVQDRLREDQERIVAEAAQEAARQRIADAQPVEKVTP